MLRAIIFDCDGVIADTEPLHLAALQKTLAEEDITLTEGDYYRHYLALDDRGCFTRAFSEHGRPLSHEKLAELITRKASHIEPVMRARLRLFPGVVEFIRASAAHYPLAVASGALRREIELILEQGGIRDCFGVIVSAEDVERGKPDPETFLKALALINERAGQDISPGECLVIEDSIHGVRAARLAGMKCLALTTSYPKDELSEADCVEGSPAELSLERAGMIFGAG
ncbi:MAG TPA: HAD family phosphatase [Blastocatellia bacterium]